MTETDNRDEEPRRVLGVPYDFRRPTVRRAKSRLWNRDDRRLLTPKTFGWGYDVNFYWLAHPAGFLRARGSEATDRHEPADSSSGT